MKWRLLERDALNNCSTGIQLNEGLQSENLIRLLSSKQTNITIICVYEFTVETSCQESSLIQLQKQLAASLSVNQLQHKKKNTCDC